MLQTLSQDPCVTCGEPMTDDRMPPKCPFSGQGACSLILPPGEEAEVDPFGLTMILPARDHTPGQEDGDTPAHEDDLAHQPLGQYRIGPLLGRGTMGRVYRAEHAGLGRPVALKIMNASLVDDEPHVLEQFWAEARAVAGLSHPHIVTVHNLGTERGYHFIEMELVEHRRPTWRPVRSASGEPRRLFVPGGVSLTEKVVREGPLAPEQATTMVRQIALALEAAHQAGLVHRDVKPANVLLTADGKAKLADFGLVRRQSDARGRARIGGTPTFMAPELFAGAPATPHSDLYAVGVMFYYLLSARLPYTADALNGLIRLHRNAPIPDIRAAVPDVPDELARVLNRLLAKAPAERYDGSAERLAAELRLVLGHLRDTESLVVEAIDGLGGFIQQSDREAFRMVFPVPGNRLQEVYVEVHQGRGGDRLLSVFSVCGPADPSHFEYALKLNARLTHGSLSVREVNGQPMFVMARTFHRGQVRTEEIRAAILEIARNSDQVEQLLTQTDVF